MKKTFEEIKRGMEDMHARMRPVFNTCFITGERIALQREGKEPVEVIIYRPEKQAAGTLPAFINMHGGSFTGGDAVLMDSFCHMLAQRLPAVVFNINYKKAPEYAFPYAIEEIYDMAVYAAQNAAPFGIDPQRIAVGGHSAGASLAAGTALKAKEEGGVSFVCQVLVYPCTDLDTLPTKNDLDCPPEADEEFRNYVRLYCRNGENGHRWASPLLATSEEIEGVCPAIFVTCGLDDLRQQGEAYAKKLIDCGVPVAVRRFAEALHGFVEVNRPDYFHEDERKSPKQETLCRLAEEFIIAQLKASFQAAN